jgi:hypothetical protein
MSSASAPVRVDTIDVSRPPPPTRVHAFVAVLGDLVLAVLLVLAIPLLVAVVGALPVVVGWTISALEGLF